MSNQGTALMGIGSAKGEGRAVEAAKKAISSPLLETSIHGAQGVLMNITGGTDLSLYEVQEAADIVGSAADKELNMIFGSIINENLKDEIMITVIATGFSELNKTPLSANSDPSKGVISKPQSNRREQVKREEPVRQDYNQHQTRQDPEDSLDIPTFLRNRNKRS
jgi:cell division protein FtsZ